MFHIRFTTRRIWRTIAIPAETVDLATESRDFSVEYAGQFERREDYLREIDFAVGPAVGHTAGLARIDFE